MEVMMTAARSLIVRVGTMGNNHTGFGNYHLLDASLDAKRVGRECHGESSFPLRQRKRQV